MKPTPTPSWDLETAQQVHKEFLRSTGELYLCRGSKTFKNLFNQEAAWQKVRAAATEFLKSSNNHNIIIGTEYLFSHPSYDWDRRALRLKFLRHEIKRLKNLENT